MYVYIYICIKLSYAVAVVSSNPCIGPPSRTKIYFFLLSTWIDELLSTEKVIIFTKIKILKSM